MKTTVILLTLFGYAQTAFDLNAELCKMQYAGSETTVIFDHIIKATNTDAVPESHRCLQPEKNENNANMILGDCNVPNARIMMVKPIPGSDVTAIQHHLSKCVHVFGGNIGVEERMVLYEGCTGRQSHYGFVEQMIMPLWPEYSDKMCFTTVSENNQYVVKLEYMGEGVTCTTFDYVTLDRLGMKCEKQEDCGSYLCSKGQCAAASPLSAQSAEQSIAASTTSSAQEGTQIENVPVTSSENGQIFLNLEPCAPQKNDQNVCSYTVGGHKLSSTYYRPQCPKGYYLQNIDVYVANQGTKDQKVVGLKGTCNDYDGTWIVVNPNLLMSTQTQSHKNENGFVTVGFAATPDHVTAINFGGVGKILDQAPFVAKADHETQRLVGFRYKKADDGVPIALSAVFGDKFSTAP